MLENIGPQFNNTRMGNLKKVEFKDYEASREFALGLQLNSVAEWRDYKKSGKRPDDIPAKPERVYLKVGWKGFGDWLGIRKTNKFEFKSFLEAREFVRELDLRSEQDWKDFKQSGKKPANIPAKPEKVYKEQGWSGYMDWLGYSKVNRNSNHAFKEFKEAREFVRNLGLSTEDKWRDYKRSGIKPADIPAKPENVYKGKGWKGFRDWLNAG